MSRTLLCYKWSKDVPLGRMRRINSCVTSQPPFWSERWGSHLSCSLKNGEGLSTARSCPEVSTCDEILQGVFQRVEPVHKPVSDGWDAKGRNEKCHHKEHHAAQRLAAYEQDKSQQGQHHHKGDGKDF